MLQKHLRRALAKPGQRREEERREEERREEERREEAFDLEVSQEAFESMMTLGDEAAGVNGGEVQASPRQLLHSTATPAHAGSEEEKEEEEEEVLLTAYNKLQKRREEERREEEEGGGGGLIDKEEGRSPSDQSEEVCT